MYEVGLHARELGGRSRNHFEWSAERRQWSELITLRGQLLTVREQLGLGCARRPRQYAKRRAVRSERRAVSAGLVEATRRG